MGEKAEPNIEVDKAKSVLATKTLKFDQKKKKLEFLEYKDISRRFFILNFYIFLELSKIFIFFWNLNF